MSIEDYGFIVAEASTLLLVLGWILYGGFRIHPILFALLAPWAGVAMIVVGENFR